MAKSISEAANEIIGRQSLMGIRPEAAQAEATQDLAKAIALLALAVAPGASVSREAPHAE